MEQRTLKIIIFVAYLAYGVKSQHVTLIGSQLMPINSDYKVYLISQDMTKDSILNITMKSDSGFETHKIFENLEGDSHQEVTFELPEDLQSSYKLNFIHKSKSTNACKGQIVNLRNNRNSNMIFTQLDKPYYKNFDTIHFRIFIMNRLLSPSTNYKNIDVKIYDGNSKPVRHFKDVKTTKFGVFENSYKIGFRPFFGMWKIQTIVDGKINTKEFQVQEWDVDEFEVLIDAPKEVAVANRKVFLDIKIKHPTEEIFTGKVKIRASTKFNNSENFLIKRDLKTATINNGEVKIVLDIEEDLGVVHPERDMDVKLDVDIIEDITRHSQKHVIKFPLRIKGKSSLKIEREPHFKPGFPFSLIICATRYETGEPDESFDSIKFTVDFGINEGTKNFVTNLSKGKLRLDLEPPREAKIIKLHAEFNGSEFEDEIEAYTVDGVAEYMQTTKRLTSDSIIVNAKTSGKFETLHVAVIGPFGVASTNSYPEANGKDNFEFTINLINEMRPEANVIVLYIRSVDGVIIRDDFKVKTGFNIDNNLSITILNEVKYKGKAALNIQTQNGSKVFLSAIENQKSYIINRDNEVSRSDVYNELSGYSHQKLNNKDSTSFTLQPLVSGGSCEEESIEDKDSHEHENIEFSIEKLIGKTFFPDTWIREDLEITEDGDLLFLKQLPDSLTSWRIQGISVHPTMGFSVLKNEPIVNPAPKFVLKVHALSTIRLGEIFRFDISAYNFLDMPQSVQVYVNIENGYFMVRKEDIGEACSNYSTKNEVLKSMILELPGESTSNPQHFEVQPKEEGKLIIKVTGTTEESRDEVIKVIKVSKREETKNAVYKMVLLNSMTEKSDEKYVIFNEPKDVEVQNVYLTVSDNLLGPLVDDAKKISTYPRDYMEQIIDEFHAAIVRAEYLESRNIQLNQNHIDDIHTGYQHAVRIFDIPPTPDQLPAPLWLQSLRASCIISARKYTNLDVKAAEKDLDRIILRQNQNGSFYEEPLYDTRREIGEEDFQQHILTAKIVMILLDYRQYSDKYDEIIEKSLNFLNSTKSLLEHDYEKSIVANAFTQAGDHESANALISSLKNEFLQTEISEKDMSMYVEFAAYLILTKLLLKEDPKLEVEWLLSHQNTEGSFYSSYDTALAMKALNAYAKMMNVEQTSLNFSLDGEKVTMDDGKFSKTIKVTKKDQYKIATTGQGFGYAQVFYEFVEKAATNVTANQFKYFTIDMKTENLSNDTVELDVTIKLVPDKIDCTNVVLIEIELPSGYQYYDGDDNKEIEMTVLKENKQHIVYYIEIFNTKTVFRQKLRAIKVFFVENYGESIIRVRDYYRPNLIDVLKYNLDSCN